MYIYSKNEWKKYKFLIFNVTKSLNASKLQLSQLKRPRKKRYYKKALQTLYGQKDHLPWNTGQEK